MKLWSSSLQVLGCVAIPVGVAFVSTVGAALIVGGALAVLLGFALEREGR